LASSGKDRRYLALWFPFLPADRIGRERRTAGCGAPDEPPLVIAGKDRGALRLSATGRKAARLGLGPGLTLADAWARVPDLDVVEADPGADDRLLLRLAAACERYSPSVALDPPHGLVLDVTGCGHLFGGETALCARLGGDLKRAGVGARWAVAGTPDAARALARFGKSGIIAPGTDESAVRPLSIAALDAPPDTLLALRRAGLKTIGDLAGRPSAILSARFGEALAAKLRRTLGRETAPLTPLRPPPPVRVERHFPEPFLHMEQMESVLAGLIEAAACILEERGEGGRVFEASFFRSDGEARRVAVETGRPTRDAGAVLRLYRERFETLADPVDPGFGFDGIRLGVAACAPLGAAQVSLDGRAVEAAALDGLVDRLVARLGRERVLRFAARDTHLPEAAFAMRPAADAAPEAIAWTQPPPDDPPARPVRIFDPPQRIEQVAALVPDGPPRRFRWRRVTHDVVRVEGPERIAPEWWRAGTDGVTRDYYRVEDSHGRRFWIFRAGIYRETADPGWFLHGLFA
jgi:protein ImuB